MSCPTFRRLVAFALFAPSSVVGRPVLLARPTAGPVAAGPAGIGQRIRVAAAAVVFISSVVALASCGASARLETTGGGHPIFATVTGPHTIESRATHATITTQSGIVTVERTRARIADGSWENIPEHVPVRVTMSKHAVSIRAGSVTISRTTR
jgi:hypothetical protein